MVLMFCKEKAINGEGWVDAIGMYVCFYVCSVRAENGENVLLNCFVKEKERKKR